MTLILIFVQVRVLLVSEELSQICKLMMSHYLGLAMISFFIHVIYAKAFLLIFNGRWIVVP